jgi:hypothetical protein
MDTQIIEHRIGIYSKLNSLNMTNIEIEDVNGNKQSAIKGQLIPIDFHINGSGSAPFRLIELFDKFSLETLNSQVFF